MPGSFAKTKSAEGRVDRAFDRGWSAGPDGYGAGGSRVRRSAAIHFQRTGADADSRSAARADAARAHGVRAAALSGTAIAADRRGAGDQRGSREELPVPGDAKDASRPGGLL